MANTEYRHIARPFIVFCGIIVLCCVLCFIVSDCIVMYCILMQYILFHCIVYHIALHCWDVAPKFWPSCEHIIWSTTIQLMSNVWWFILFDFINKISEGSEIIFCYILEFSGGLCSIMIIIRTYFTEYRAFLIHLKEKYR